MAARRTRVTPTTQQPEVLAQALAAFDAVRQREQVPEEFGAEALKEAQDAARRGPEPSLADRTDLPFVTIDPAGSMDLDQAMHLSRTAQGYLVRYAIADVPSFVAPGGRLDAEARLRGETVYAPDRRTPLHPTVLSEDGASLLPGQVRPAFVWEIALDTAGATTDVHVARGLVRSVARLDYEGVQRDIDAGTADPMLGLLKEIGLARQEQERLRGGASLPMPEQDVSVGPDGTLELVRRPMLPAEDWNAQISLLTGFAAAELMISGGVGILRTMPPADPRAIDRLRRQAAVLGVPWAPEQPYGEFLRSLDGTDPTHLAVIHAATSLFRGAAYTAFDGQAPEAAQHAALAARYAHVTAPLRRLGDRFGLVVAESLSTGRQVPDWCRAALPELPKLMSVADRRAKAVDRSCIDIVEAALLSAHVGEAFDATVVERTDKGPVLVQLNDPPVLAPCEGQAALGSSVRVRLRTAEVSTGTVMFVTPA